MAYCKCSYSIDKTLKNGKKSGFKNHACSMLRPISRKIRKKKTEQTALATKHSSCVMITSFHGRGRGFELTPPAMERGFFRNWMASKFQQLAIDRIQDLPATFRFCKIFLCMLNVDTNFGEQTGNAGSNLFDHLFIRPNSS